MCAENDRAELTAFLRGDIDPAGFHHADHLRMAYLLLRLLPFAEALGPYSRALQRIAGRAGRPQAYHETITVAFLSLIAQRMEGRAYSSFESFENSNPDLLDKTILERWYPREQLGSEMARRLFVLPQERTFP